MEFSRAFSGTPFLKTLQVLIKKKIVSLKTELYLFRFFIVSSYDRLKVVGCESNAAAEWWEGSFEFVVINNARGVELGYTRKRANGFKSPGQ